MRVRFRNPRLRFITDAEALEASTAAAAAAAGDPDPKFPANTPVKDMTPDQQIAFHESKGRKLEDKLKLFGGLTPEQVTALVKERDDLKTANQTDSEKAIEEARESGRAEVRTVLGAERFRTAFTAALAGRTADPAALLDLDRSQFIKGDKPDADAIKVWVEKNSTAVTAEEKRKPVRIGQGNRDTIHAAAGEKGKAEAERRFGSK
ncbi:hypothetical protein [Cryobacterium cryoconiti]|uniref:Uncharacterized protein n=1 Tax=Cryobacterium cryoconiti TaxID=1259239 RepID=A0A4Y8JS69_9MICO|nr:hypothetical protein [Cryobacterium cryoconiti]TFD27514.1 hypothetical protein E3T49_13310 [Cryobacterium cryoconiti]